MTLKEKISDLIKDAMRAKDQGALRALRAVKSAILLAETAEGANGYISSEDELKLLMKQAKQRKDSAQQFRDNGRDDLAQTEEEELAVIENLLPKPLTEAEIEAEVKAIIAETGASGMKDMGKVMGLATKKMAGRAEGGTISGMVKKILAS
ncbi:MAG: GatB/YqeY domain-containing protein [Bacteroidia bacterium]|nr:GatB/YqeY domain-containing protein [Bacteroidia bacterium]